MNDRLRIGDADREAAARELGEHFAVGRITADEHSERLEQIWAARTAADLAPAFRDLPRSREEKPQATLVRRDRRPGLPRVPFLFRLLVAIVAIWWGVHHPLFLLLAVVVYVVLVRRILRHVTRPRRPWHHRYQTGWR